MNKLYVLIVIIPLFGLAQVDYGESAAKELTSFKTLFQSTQSDFEKSNNSLKKLSERLSPSLKDYYSELEEEVDIYKSQCNNDRTGTRHADRCTQVHTQIGQLWSRDKTDKRVRKVYISKPSSSGGSETLQIFKNNKLIVEQPIGPGTKGEFFKGDSKGIIVKVTTTGLGPNGQSTYYIHVEWYK